jgi:hypothetical protein
LEKRAMRGYFLVATGVLGVLIAPLHVVMPWR